MTGFESRCTSNWTYYTVNESMHAQYKVGHGVDFGRCCHLAAADMHYCIEGLGVNQLWRERVGTSYNFLETERHKAWLLKKI